MKKVAVLICGLVRTYKKTNKNFILNILEKNNQNYQIDVFLAFWDHTHQRGSMGTKVEKRKLLKKEIQNIIEIYSPKKYIILGDYEEKNKLFKIKSKEIGKRMGHPNHEDGLVLIQNGILAQSYTWQKAFSLIDEKYDLVLKTRFDAASEAINIDDVKNNYFNCSGPTHQFAQYGLADVIFSSDYRTMKKVMFDYHNIAFKNNLPILTGGYPNIFQEYILKEFLKQSDIKINYIEKKVYVIR